MVALQQGGEASKLMCCCVPRSIEYPCPLQLVPLQEQLAVARKGFAHLQAELQAQGEPPIGGGSRPRVPARPDSDGDLPDPSSLPGAASRDMLLSQLVTWDPTAPDAPTPANVLRQFREVDRPLAPLAAQMDTDTGLAAGNSLLWVRPPVACVFCFGPRALNRLRPTHLQQTLQSRSAMKTTLVHGKLRCPV